MTGAPGGEPRESILARLAAYRDARADIANAVKDARLSGMGTSAIARASGLTRAGVDKMLARGQGRD